MQENPYSLEKKPAGKVSNALAPRPIAAWLLILALIASSTLVSLASSQFFLLVAHRWADIRDYTALAVGVTWRIALVAAFVAAVIGIYSRRQWGRWLGLLAIAAFATSSVLGPDTTAYANEAQKAGGFLGRMILGPLAFVWWAYAFGFSRKAKRYFLAKEHCANGDEAGVAP